MTLDTQSHEFQLLRRQLQKGNVVLFAGAGFSIGATNLEGTHPPLGNDLASRLADECGWQYSGEDLTAVFDQARKHLGSQNLNAIISRLYRDCQPAAWHRELSRIHWYRIYTTNIDDVIQESYRSSAVQRLDTIVCPAPYQDQDVWYSRVQCIHLHGSVSDFSKPFTFSLEDFAAQTATPSAWYQALVDDMMSKSFLFVGARLNDPLFFTT